MKPSWKLLVASLTVLAGTAGSAQLLKNASFETPLDPENWGCDQPAHWIRWGNWMNRETAWAPTKNGECLIGFHHFRLKGPDNAGFYQDIRDAKQGALCTFTIHAWKDKGSNFDEVRLEMHSYHGGSVLTTAVYRASSIKEDRWTPLTLTGRNPAEGLRVMVVVEPKPSGLRKGALKFDDAEFSAGE
ncbi:MAG: hypothetical protein BWY59_01226 [Verrucomicrobia bacterium ADurb.Bin345]|nr:MAG: hypothetical protein BWY59_01226 [Verrucomicrobia bacterium ADurb.Bin345]